MGIYPAKIDMMWLADNVSGHYKRATMVSVTIAIGNSSGLIVGQIFTTQSKPRYIKGLSVTVGELPLSHVSDLTAMASLSLATAFTLMYGMSRLNKRRETLICQGIAEGNPIPEQPEKGDYNPHFRYNM